MYQHEKRKAHSHTSRSSGVRETSLSAIPTDSATGGQTSNQQSSQPSGQSQTSQNSSQPSWYGKTPEQMTREELREYVDWQSGGAVTAGRPGELDMDASASIQLNGQ